MNVANFIEAALTLLTATALGGIGWALRHGKREEKRRAVLEAIRAAQAQMRNLCDVCHAQPAAFNLFAHDARGVMVQQGKVCRNCVEPVPCWWCNAEPAGFSVRVPGTDEFRHLCATCACEANALREKCGHA